MSKQQATDEVTAFLNSGQQVLLLSGTNQNEKHQLALATVFTVCPPGTAVLFRVNKADNCEQFLRPLIQTRKKPRPGQRIGFDGYHLYVDTINPASWSSSPNPLDVAVVYPIDALNHAKADACMTDLLRRNAQKIILVTWTDNRDFAWVDQYGPVRVVYDAEDRDYHERVMSHTTTKASTRRLPRLPAYAKAVPREYLIRIACRGGCGGTRWARLNKPYPGPTPLRDATMGEFEATCLKCGHRASDNYNWYE